MPNKGIDILNDENYAMINGKKYPIKFVGYDEKTYKHIEGCLAYSNSQGACQCGALDRAAQVYGIYVTPKDN